MLNVTYLCNVTLDPEVVEWVALNEISCERSMYIYYHLHYFYALCYSICIMLYTVTCPYLMEPLNGRTSCSLLYPSMVLYEDTCSFTCNTGYVLFGSSTRTCQSDGSWSGSEVICTQLAGNFTKITLIFLNGTFVYIYDIVKC